MTLKEASSLVRSDHPLPNIRETVRVSFTQMVNCLTDIPRVEEVHTGKAFPYYLYAYKRISLLAFPYLLKPTNFALRMFPFTHAGITRNVRI